MPKQGKPTYLLVLGEHTGIWWVLSHRRMAFTPGRAGEARQLGCGAVLLLYATRGAFHNPTRDRGRVIGQATVTSAVELLAEPVEIAGREFTVACDIQLDRLAPRGHGPELAALVVELAAFNDNLRGWSVRLRRPLVPLNATDAHRIMRPLIREAVSGPDLDAAVSTYRCPTG